MKRIKFLLTGILASLIIFIGCAKEEKETSIDELLQKGKDCLQKNDYACAYEAFKKVLDKKPNNEQAKYGIILANDQNLSYGLSGALNMFLLKPYEPTDKECKNLCTNLDECGWLETWGLDLGTCLNMCDPSGEASFGYSKDVFICVANAKSCSKVEECLSPLLEPTQEDCIDTCFKLNDCRFMNPDTYGVQDCIDRCPNLYTMQETRCFLKEKDCKKAINCFMHYGPLIQTLIDGFYFNIAEEPTKYAKDISQLDDFEFNIDYLAFSPLDLLGLPILLASGKHDVATSNFYSSIEYLHLALFKIVLSLNIDININTIKKLPPAPTSIFDLDGIISYLEAIRDMLTDILYDPARPGFGLLTTDGEELLPSSSHDIASAARAIRLAIEGLKLKEFSKDYAFPLEDLNGDKLWSEDEFVYLRGWSKLDHELADAIIELCAELEACFDNGEPFELSSLKPLFKYYDLWYINMLISLLDLAGYSKIDLSKPLLDPHPNGIRDYVDQVVHIIDLLIQLLRGVV